MQREALLYTKCMKDTIVFFDFDGVIADTFESNMVINRLHSSDLSDDEYRAFFNGNVNTEIAKRKDRLMPTEQFFSHYERSLQDAVLFSGMDECLREISKQHELIIVSSTISPLIEAFLKRANLHEHFLEILGNDVHHSKVVKFKWALEKYNLTPSHALLITDTLGDIREADEVGLPSVAVAWGFHSPVTLETGNPYVIVDKPQDILHYINLYFNGIS